MGAGRNAATNLSLGPAAATIAIVGALAFAMQLVAPSVAASIQPQSTVRPTRVLTGRGAARAHFGERSGSRAEGDAGTVRPVGDDGDENDDEDEGNLQVHSRARGGHARAVFEHPPAVHVHWPGMKMQIPATDVHVPRQTILIPPVDVDVPAIQNAFAHRRDGSRLEVGIGGNAVGNGRRRCSARLSRGRG